LLHDISIVVARHLFSYWVCLAFVAGADWDICISGPSAAAVPYFKIPKADSTTIEVVVQLPPQGVLRAMRGINMADYVEGVVGVAARVEEACEAAAREACRVLNGMRLITDASFDTVNNSSSNSREVPTSASTTQAVHESGRTNTIVADRLDRNLWEEDVEKTNWL
jgi:hypothetical protein